MMVQFVLCLSFTRCEDRPAPVELGGARVEVISTVYTAWVPCPCMHSHLVCVAGPCFFVNVVRESPASCSLAWRGPRGCWALAAEAVVGRRHTAFFTVYLPAQRVPSSQHQYRHYSNDKTMMVWN